jgi:hypothetical protein
MGLGGLSARGRTVVSTIAALALIEGCGGSGTMPTPVPPSPPATTAACGDERWSVKTLTDPDAIRVDLMDATSTTIGSLNALTAHCSDLPERRTFAEEFRVYQVVGVVQLARNEADHDVHIALADPDDATKTIVVEVADPSCATTSPFITTLVNARSQYQALGALPGRRVLVRGVGFYDFAHGQTGRSQSCIELHPVLGISSLSP